MKYKTNRMLIMLAVLSLFSFSCKYSPCAILEDSSEETVVQCLKAGPKEDILLIPEVKAYLSKHKVYISLTTSPLRISKILPVLETLDLEFVENILLVLPVKFSRDGSEYVIPKEIKDFPKVKILRIEKDLGPITKLLPAIVYVNHSAENEKAGIVITTEEPVLTPDPSPDPDAIVITVDDDTGYFRGSISQLIKYNILENAVVSRTAVEFSDYKIPEEFWPQSIRKQPEASVEGLVARDIVEGWGGIAYRAKHVAVRKMSKLSALGKICNSADDLVISWILDYELVPRFEVINMYIERPIQFSFGFEKDALHKGVGDGSNVGGVPARDYAACAKIATETVQFNF